MIVAYAMNISGRRAFFDGKSHVDKNVSMQINEWDISGTAFYWHISGTALNWSGQTILQSTGLCICYDY